MLPRVLDLDTVRTLYASGGWTPASLLAALADRIAAADPAVFISLTSVEAVGAALAALHDRAPEANSLPLWGVPFAVKDNLDVADLPTTAACPSLVRRPTRDATVVAALKAAGAIVVGKTNLDQLATGLSGTRSPYGVPRSVFDPEYISGGSSSGSAVAVAAGLVSFALGTDTAGSGRVPAAFNNIVGIKPTPGLISTSGLVPACRSLDCVSIFALTVGDGVLVRRLAEGFDADDPYSRRAVRQTLPASGLRIGVLAADDREFFGDDAAAGLYQAAIDQLGETVVEIDYAPFRDTARLLYEGPWVAERLAAVEELGVPIDALEPSVAAIIRKAAAHRAADVFSGQYALATLQRAAAAEWARADVIILPTAPTTYTVAAMLADPIRLNSRLGLYTNSFNLLGLCALAVPAGFADDGLPFGVTLAAPAFSDDALSVLADRLHRSTACGLGVDRAARVVGSVSWAAGSGRLRLAVVGAHLAGMALNHELLRLGATLEDRCRTSAGYRLYLLPVSSPPKPGLVRDPGFAGPGIEVEVWSLDEAAFGRFIQSVPAPLSVGKIEFEDGQEVSGFLSEPAALAGAQEITVHGGWRRYLASRDKMPPAQ